MLFKVVNTLFCIIFVIAAALQYNDPDPYVWMPIYLFAAVYCGLAATNRFYPKAYIGGIIVFSIYAAYLFFVNEGVLDWMRRHQSEDIAQTMKATKPWIEQTREFF